MTSTLENHIDVAAAALAADAAAAVLPATTTLKAGSPTAGTSEIATSFAGAALAELDGAAGGALVVLVGTELVAALASSPLGGLDLAAAVQPALDAAAGSLGTTARAARVIDVALVENDLGAGFTIVPLEADGVATAALALTDVAISSAPAQPAKPAPQVGAPTQPRGIEMLHGVIMDVTVELGRTRMSVRDLLALTPGKVLELDRAAGSPADLLVNGRRIARGEVVVVDEDFGLRVTEIVDDSSAS